MSAISRASVKLGAWGLVLTVLFTLVETEEAQARGRRCMRRGAVARVRAGRRVVVRRVVPSQNFVVRNNNFNNNLLAGFGNNNNNLNNNFDFGPASFAPINSAALGQINGLQPLNGFNNIAVAANGQFFELNNGAVVNGAIVDPNTAVRQQLVGFNGNLFAGSNGSLLPDTSFQIRAFNQGIIPSSSAFVGSSFNNGFGANQVISIRNR